MAQITLAKEETSQKILNKVNNIETAVNDLNLEVTAISNAVGGGKQTL